MNRYVLAAPRIIPAVMTACLVTLILSLFGQISPSIASTEGSLSTRSGALPEIIATPSVAPLPKLEPPKPYVPPTYQGSSPYGSQTGPEIPAGFVFPERITQSEYVQKPALTPLATCHNEKYTVYHHAGDKPVKVLKSGCHHDYLAADMTVVPFKTIIVAPVSGTATIVNNPSTCDGYNVPSFSFRSDRKFEGTHLWFYLTHMAPSSVVHYPSGKPWLPGQHVKVGEQIGIGGPADPHKAGQECADYGVTTAHLHMDVSRVPDDFARPDRKDPLVAEAMYDPMPMLQFAFKRLPR